MPLIIVTDKQYRMVADALESEKSVILMPESMVIEIAQQIGLDPHNNPAGIDQCAEDLHDYVSTMNDPHGGEADVFLDFAGSVYHYVPALFIEEKIAINYTRREK